MSVNWYAVLSSSAISAAISGIISYAIARHTTKSEIKRMQLTWNRQDAQAEEAAMQSMLSAVNLWLGSGNIFYYEQALTHVASFLGQYSGNLGDAISGLNSALANRDSAQVRQYQTLVAELFKQNRLHKQN